MTSTIENTASSVSGIMLRSLIERIERLECEKKVIQDDITEILSEAKSNGFDPKIIRQLVRLRKLDEHDRDEQEHLLYLYMREIGMKI